MSHPDDMPHVPDGPTPAREQLPLPRRQRQAHLEPYLRTPPGNPGTGTPFAAFATGDDAEATWNVSNDRPADRSERAAAFHAGTQRGRSAGVSHRGSARRRGDH